MSYWTIAPSSGSALGHRMKTKFIRYRPQIMTGVGVTCMAGATVWAVKQTPEAMRRLEKRKEELNVQKLPVTEVIKTAGPCYLGPAALTLAGGASIWKADHDMRGRVADMTALAATAENMRQTYKEAVKEEVGKKKAEKIEADMAQKLVDKNPPPADQKDIVDTGYGDQIVYDPTYTKKYFRCSIERIYRGQNNANHTITTSIGMSVSVPEFFEEFGMADYVPDGFKTLEWTNDNPLDISFYDPVTDRYSEKAVVLVMTFGNHLAKMDEKPF